MASTPPLQIVPSTPETPLTPLHGAAYDRRPTRTSSRIAARKPQFTPDAPQRIPIIEEPVATPKTSRQSRTRPAPGIQSPDSTPRKKAPRRVQVISPSSPDLDTQPPKPMPRSKARLQPFASSSTTISDSMLPTPSKTPKKKVVSSANKAARVLFQDNPTMVDFEPSPKRNRKSKRYNGFSLESFSAEDDQNRGQIQIYTDSRDRVPQVDASQSNPFVDHELNGEKTGSRRIAGTTKRRKVSEERSKIDPQVAAALEDDEGMVYVFRGKKVYRRFDDEEDDEEEEEIDEADLGLLEHSPDSRPKSLRPLTRRSVKPRRLFQSEAQKKAWEAAEEEEALTDIEEPTGQHEDADAAGPSSPSLKTGRSLRSTGKPSLLTDEAEANSPAGSGNKKTSPFDAWPRLKAGGRLAGVGHKGKKRNAPDSTDDIVETTVVEAKKTKS